MEREGGRKKPERGRNKKGGESGGGKKNNNSETKQQTHKRTHTQVHTDKAHQYETLFLCLCSVSGCSSVLFLEVTEPVKPKTISV